MAATILNSPRAVEMSLSAAVKLVVA